jgi:hypothetical protein
VVFGIVARFKALSRVGLAEAAQKRVARDIVISCSWGLPATYLGLGDIARARILVDEAIVTCSQNRVRTALVRAHIVSAAIHRADPRSNAAAAAASDLETAEALIEETGAGRFLGLVLEGRGKLREALNLYEKQGAVGHAKRVAQLLAE